MRAGRLRHRLTYQTPTQESNDLGQLATTGWTDVGTIWADVRPQSAREALIAQSMEAQVDVTIVCRDPRLFRVEGHGRLVDLDGPGAPRIHHIVGVMIDPKTRDHTILASERVEADP